MIILACKVMEKSLTKNFILRSTERKKIGQIRGRISRRRLVLNPRIQQVITNLHSKYDHSSLHGCGEIFDEKFHKKGTGRRTEEQKDGRTDVNQYTPHFLKVGVQKTCIIGQTYLGIQP